MTGPILMTLTRSKSSESILYNDIDNAYTTYEIDRADNLVVYSDRTPQMITVHESRFHVPLYDLGHLMGYNEYEIKNRDVVYDLLYHVSNTVKSVKDIEGARQIFYNRNIPFLDDVIVVNKHNMPTIKFALADMDFRGVFVIHTAVGKSPTSRIGCFMWLKSIVRIAG